MTTPESAEAFVDRFLAECKAEARARSFAKGWAEGCAEGWAEGILRVLAARGVRVPVEIQQQVLACRDISQLEMWCDRAATADSIEDVFGS
jgi:hypothetical protein